MKKKTNSKTSLVKMICDFCGSYWTANRSHPNDCAICGAGSPVEMNGDLDTRREDRKHEFYGNGVS